MPKIRKLKRKKSFKANINRKRLRNKLRKLPDIPCKDVKAAWEKTKSTRHNLGDMGLAYDANEALKIPNTKREFLEEARNLGSASESEDEKDVKKFIPSKSHVALSLEAEAKAPRVRMFRLPNQQVQFVTYLMDKYDEDYKAMARDKKNYYQMTWRQIRAKINTFKGVPEQYAEYLLKKGDIVLDDPETIQETRKRIAEENVLKHCAKKVKKIKPKEQKSPWLVESDDEMDFDTEDKLEDVGDEEAENLDGAVKEPEKKLKLFSDDENDEEDEEEITKSKNKSKKKLEDVKVTKLRVEPKDAEKTVVKAGKKAKNLEILPSSDSESDEELLEEDEEDEEAGFVDLNELSDEELSEDDVLDDGEFVTDSDESE